MLLVQGPFSNSGLQVGLCLIKQPSSCMLVTAWCVRCQINPLGGPCLWAEVSAFVRRGYSERKRGMACPSWLPVRALLSTMWGSDLEATIDVTQSLTLEMGSSWWCGELQGT